MNTEPVRLKRRVKWRRLFAAASLLVMLVVLRGCFLRPGTNYLGAHFNRGQNAAWLGVEWSMEPHGDQEIATLVADLRERQIRTIFVYASYLKPHNIFNPTYSYAADFVRQVKSWDVSLEVQAWIGVPLAAPMGSSAGVGYVDLTDLPTRQVVVQFAADLLRDAGFDGLHLNAEPVGNDDQALLHLLRELRLALGPNKQLSLAVPAKLPLVGELPVLKQSVWSEKYYRAVAAQVDALAVMTYDSAMPAAFLYRSWQQLQVVSLSRALANVPAKVYLGIPTSKETTNAHLPWAENMRAGLAGVITGLNDNESQPSAITGVAIYPYWETTEDEWQTYAELWLGQKSP